MRINTVYQLFTVLNNFANSKTTLAHIYNIGIRGLLSYGQHQGNHGPYQERQKKSRLHIGSRLKHIQG